MDSTPNEPLAGRYQLLQPLGRKAGRQTWLAQDGQTQERVVVKLLTFGSDFSWDDLKMFEREVETLRSLSHPAIPRYLDSFELDTPTNKGFALVQTYIPASSLEQQLRMGHSFTEAEVKQLAKALLEILVYLHDRQPSVIHRDLKPSNILLGDRTGHQLGQVYLVDFGAVQTAIREGSTMTVVGTYGYMPPEQFGGRATPASDLYSLGATLIYLTTGRHPAELPQNDLRIDFEQAAHLSPSFSSWLKWMTEPSPSKRPGSARDALTGLERKAQPHVKTADPLTKPRHSKIELTRNAQFIEIVLPTQKLILLKSWSWWIVILLFFGMPVVLGAVALLVLTRLFGKTRMIVSQQHVSIVRELFGWQYRRPLTVPLRHVWQLELLSRRVTPRLLLWAGTQSCEIRGHRAELEWLAYELSDWIDLPISED
ncbi:serine/threonine protein kinase [Leptolyngbya sp. FACHB-36]|nr:serine/threonine protein kinase [Leptolyngbya sp. FACHB-36]